MGGRNLKSQDYYIERCKATHGDKYDYSKFNYESFCKDVIIICPVHGEFKQRALNHIHGKGCPKCSGTHRYNTDEIKHEFIKVHGNKYDYSKVLYKNIDSKVIITCPEHGEFLQTPYKHKLGSGCPECGSLKKAKSRKIKKEEILKAFKKAHSNRYDYSQVVLTAVSDKVKIICREHGGFLQLPTSHRKGIGCPHCANDKKHGFTLTKYKEISRNGYDGLSYLYLIQCTDSEESFYKVGISVRGVKNRYNNKKAMPYDYKILYNALLPVEVTWNLEREICKLLKPYHYTPSVYFAGGLRECFSDINDRVIGMIESAIEECRNKAA